MHKYLFAFIALFGSFALPAHSAEQVINGTNLIQYLKVLADSGDGLTVSADSHYRMNGLSTAIKAMGKKAYPENVLRFEKNTSEIGYAFWASKEKNAYYIFAELFNNKVSLAPLDDFDRRNNYIQKIVLTYLDCDLSTQYCTLQW